MEQIRPPEFVEIGGRSVASAPLGQRVFASAARPKQKPPLFSPAILAAARSIAWPARTNAD